MDTFVSVTIGGNEQDLQFHAVRIRQELFSPCQIDLSLGFQRHESSSRHREVMQKWLGQPMVVSVRDEQEEDATKTYRGVVTAMGLQMDGLTVRAHSEDYALSVAQRHRSFVNKKLFDVVGEIVKPALPGARLTAPPNSLSFRFLHQYNESDLDFLRRLAQRDGCVFFHDGEHFIYDSRLCGTDSVTLSAERASELQLSCSLGASKFAGVFYDYLKHAPSAQDITRTTGSAKLAGGPFSDLLYAKSQELFSVPAEMIAENFGHQADLEQYLKNQQASRVGVHVELGGRTNHPRVAIGREIRLSEAEGFESPFVITKMNAYFAENVYTADFAAVPKDSVVAPIVPADAHQTSGLQPGLVVDNHDPEMLGRVQVRMVWDPEGSALALARVVQAGAGHKYGTHFTPRVGDQVLVGFEHGNPSFPTVLGAMYHSENKPDFVTENGSEEVLVVRTPGESVIRVLDEKGTEQVIVSMRDNKNIVRMELDGPRITVESVQGTILVHAKDVTVKADEKLEMKAQEISLQSQQNMKVIVGKDLTTEVGGNSKESVTADKEVTAGKNLTEKAGAKAELSAAASVKISSAQVESQASALSIIKGAMVQIN